MGGTVRGGLKARDANLRNDPDFYRRIGQKGGLSPKTKPSGFAANRELARQAGRKGGTISRRTGIKFGQESKSIN